MDDDGSPRFPGMSERDAVLLEAELSAMAAPPAIAVPSRGYRFGQRASREGAQSRSE